MKVIKNLAIVEDSWQLLRVVPETGPPAGDAIVPFHWWLEHASDVVHRNGRTGVLIDGDTDPEALVPHLSQWPLIALDFSISEAGLVDGRCYSSARLLRERFQYQEELRAVGDVLRDQLLFMNRCGIDSFHIRDDRDAEEALAAFQEISVYYQSTADDKPPVHRCR